MCTGSSPSPTVMTPPPRRDMTYAYKDAGLEEIKVASAEKPKTKTKNSATSKTTKSPKSSLNIG